MAMNMGMGTNPLAAMGGGMGITGLPAGMAAGSTSGSGLAGIFSEAQAMMGLLGAVQYAPGALGGISSELGMTAFGLQQILADIPQILAMGNPAGGMMGQTGMPGMGLPGMSMTGMPGMGLPGMPGMGMTGMGMM